jgi:hypothetical protein
MQWQTIEDAKAKDRTGYLPGKAPAAKGDTG